MATGCGHCGFVGELEQKANVTADKHVGYADNYGEYTWEHVWSLSRCPQCKQATLEAYTWADDFSDPADVETSRLFPSIVDNSALPPAVQKQLDVALQVKLLEPGLYAVAIRRVLEAVCREEGAAGANLYRQIGDLVERGRLPDVFARMATQLRQLGNLGAHVMDAEVVQADVPLIEEFSRSLLDYLYRGPARVEAVESALRRRLADAEPGS